MVGLLVDTHAKLPSLGEQPNKLTDRIKNNVYILSFFFILSWLGVWLLAYIVEYVHHASVWFPAAGMTFAGLLVVGARLIPALVICAIVSTMWTGYLYDLNMSMLSLLFPGIVFAVTHITPYYIATRLLKRLASNRVNQLPALMILFLLIAFLSSLVTAFAVIYGLVFSGLMESSDVATTWLAFWVGDMAGIIAIGPLFVGIINKAYPKSQFWLGELKNIATLNSSQHYLSKLMISEGLLITIMFLTSIYPTHESSLAAFLMILPLMWISYTESPVRTAMSVALFSLSVAFLVNLFGLMDFVLTYQFTICIISASAFFYLSVPSLLAHNDELWQKAMTDQLTGVATRDHLLNQAEIEIAQSHHNHSSISLLVLDVDNFKTINDTLGHTGGDKVLIEVSQAMAINLRKADLLSRFGGDEFAILLPNTDIDEAKQIAERILKQVQSRVPTDDICCTCSIGASELKSGEGFSQLFERADIALYRAKDLGRNQVCVLL